MPNYETKPISAVSFPPNAGPVCITPQSWNAYKYVLGNPLNGVAERASAVSGTLGTQQTNYVGSVQYWPHGAPQVYQYGNNVWPVNSFDKVLRPQETYSTVGNNPNYWLLYITNAWNTNSTLGSLSEGYGPAVTWGNMTWYNGSFGYDYGNRLISATDTGWSRAFSYL